MQSIPLIISISFAIFVAHYHSYTMKHIATIIFYDTVFEEADSKRLDRIARMIRRERLPLLGERYEHIPCRFDDFLKARSTSSGSFVEIEGAVEVRYLVTLESADPKKLFALTAMLRAFAEYCGICSRLFSLSSQ